MSNIITVILALSAYANADVGTILDSSKLPQCAFSCANLLNAQLLCVPPTAPQSNQATYQTCFCTSNYLVNYRVGSVSPSCDEACTSADDRNKILQWYQGLCNGGAVVTPAGNNAAAVGVTGTATDTASTSTSISAGQSGSSSGGSGHPSWIQIHYRWIIMVAVLFVAGVLAVILGLWLKRRHDRKWALGGFTREAMLSHGDATNALQNRHPGAPMSVSQVDMPTAYNGVGISRGSHAGVPKGKSRAQNMTDKEFEGEESRAGVGRSKSHRLEKRGSKTRR